MWVSDSWCRYEHFPSFWDGGLGFCIIMLVVFAYGVQAQFFWIFKVFVPKGQMDFNFEVFQNLGFLPCFARHSIFLSFLGTMLVVDLDHLFGC